jgi:hypothetical protein
MTVRLKAFLHKALRTIRKGLKMSSFRILKIWYPILARRNTWKANST